MCIRDRKYVLPDVVIVKYRGGKYITPNDPEKWKQYEVRYGEKIQTKAIAWR